MLKKAVFLTSILAVTQIFAADVLIKAGANNSWFATEGGTSETKPAVGIGMQFPLDESKVIKLGVDVLYVGQKMILKDRTIPGSLVSDNDCDVYSCDLHLNYHYLNVPVYLNSIVFQRSNTTVIFTCGIGLKYVIGNDSATKNYSFNLETCNYDYERVWTDGHPSHPIEMMVGGGFSYKYLGIELLYHYTIGKTESLYGLKIQDHIHSIRLMLFWRFH